MLNPDCKYVQQYKNTDSLLFGFRYGKHLPLRNKINLINSPSEQEILSVKINVMLTLLLLRQSDAITNRD
jgi:hypothetical protein